MIGMKRNKAAMIKRRQSLLAVMAVVLILLALVTGFLGFAHKSDDLIAAPSLPQETLPQEILPWDTAPQETLPQETPSQETLPQETQPPETLPQETQPLETLPQETPSQETLPQNTPPQETLPQNTPPHETQPQETLPTKVPILPPDAAAPSQAGVIIPIPGETENSAAEQTPLTAFRLAMRIACFTFTAGACVGILLLAMLRKNVREHERANEMPLNPPKPVAVHPVPITKETVEETVCPIPGVSIGKIHDIGRRDYQQDSFGQTAVLRNTGILAVLADGMGGLSGGERVSQKIVMEALTFGSTLQANQVPTALPGMVAGINRAVNQMLGPKGLYTSGSTVVSTLITGNALRWISVGDSRVYLYRDGQISQLSRDHDLLQDWMPDILEGKRSMAEALRDPNGRKLTSFIGMGELRHVDYNRTPIPLLPGDRVLLMSDGVYGTVSDAEIAAILRDCGSVQLAASHIGQRIMGAALPYQDNYTLIVLGYDPPDQPRNNR